LNWSGSCKKTKWLRIRQDQQAGVRDGRGDIFGMWPLDRLIVVVIDDEDQPSEAPRPFSRPRWRHATNSCTLASGHTALAISAKY